MRFRSILAILTCVSLAAPAAAADTKPTGWQTWTWDKSCYAVLFPENPGVAALETKKAYVAIRHIPTEGTSNSISFVSGLDEPELTGVAEVDGKPFNLLVFQGSGFVSSGERETNLLHAMTTGSNLVVRWTSADTMIEQKYKLAGLDQAKRTIDTACLGTRPAN